MMISQTLIAIAGHVSIYVTHSGNWLMEEGLAGYDNNDLAAGMVLVSGLAFGLGLAEAVGWRKWLALLCAALCGHATLLSFSRGGMLGFVTCGVAAFALVRGERRHYKVLALGVLVALFLAGPAIRERFATIFVKGKDTRGPLRRKPPRLLESRLGSHARKPDLRHRPGQLPGRATKKARRVWQRTPCGERASRSPTRYGSRREVSRASLDCCFWSECTRSPCCNSCGFSGGRHRRTPGTARRHECR